MLNTIGTDTTCY